MRLINNIITYTMANKVFQVIGGLFCFICILISFWIIFSLYISNNKFTYPDDLECRRVDQYTNVKKLFTISEDLKNIWNYKIDVNDLMQAKGHIQMSCPSYFYKDSQLIIDNNLIASTKSISKYVSSYHINDCHDSSIYFIDTTFRQSNPAFKDYFVIKQIWKSDSSIFYGYVVKKSIDEKGFTIIDENKNVLAKVSKKDFSLSWEIEIFDDKHPAANPSLILLIISKSYFDTARSTRSTNDLCNMFYVSLSVFILDNNVLIINIFIEKKQ